MKFTIFASLMSIFSETPSKQLMHIRNDYQFEYQILAPNQLGAMVVHQKKLPSAIWQNGSSIYMLLKVKKLSRLPHPAYIRFNIISEDANLTSFNQKNISSNILTRTNPVYFFFELGHYDSKRAALDNLKFKFEIISEKGRLGRTNK